MTGGPLSLIVFRVRCRLIASVLSQSFPPPHTREQHPPSPPKDHLWQCTT
jgi:hypothetical protein